MRVSSAVAALAVVILLGVPPVLSAQTLRGKLVDSRKDPVPDAIVTLRDDKGVDVKTDRTDDLGVFHFVTGKAGSYTVSLIRLGFEPYTTEPVALRDRETLEIEIRLNERAAVMPTMTVHGRSRREWGRDGFADRKAAGVGVFLLGIDIMRQKKETVIEGMGIVEGFQVLYRPFPELVNTKGRRCLQFMVNNQLIPRIPDEMPEMTLHRMLGPEDVMGIEVYREFKEVPTVFKQFAYQENAVPTLPPGLSMGSRPLGGSAAPETRPCGLVNVWTRKAW
jgi:hypothetical protein